MVAASGDAFDDALTGRRGRLATVAGGNPKHRSKGDEIRARIAANRARRLAIAEAMKREAGVRGHEISGEDQGGLAWIDHDRIRSPEGRNMVQLYTLAHECGHIFLHRKGNPGYWYPGHVKEHEAESYAHQAFAAHGMRLPRRITDWGRSYVGSWVEKDRAAGLAIDPRAEAYARGTRSPFEPLRLVPATWPGAVSRIPEIRITFEPLRTIAADRAKIHTPQAEETSRTPVPPEPRPDRQSLPRASRPRLLDIRSGWAIWLGLRPDDNYYYRIGAGIPKEPSLARCAARLLIVVAATPIAALLIYLLTDLQRELQVNALLACWLAYIWLRELTASIDAAGAERRARRRGDAHLPAEFRLAAARGSRAPLGGAPGVA